MKNTDEPVVVVQIFEKSIEKIWKAITDLAEMKQWFFANIASFKPEVGFETQFVVYSEDRKFTHLWKVTEVSHKQKITYNWKYLEYPGDSNVSFELAEENEQVKLTLTHSVVESFPKEIPEFTRESGIRGWNYFITGSLKEYLEMNSE